MYEVYVECDEDVPGSSGPMTFEGWRALDIDRPTRSPDLAFVAFDGDEVVGYAVADLFGDEGHHGFTAVKRAVAAPRCRDRPQARPDRRRDGAGAEAPGHRERGTKPADADAERKARLSARPGAQRRRPAGPMQVEMTR